ncbi:MAG: spore germination GerAC like [Symbiobacteriaceae bacterium]|nr:spore germination GerAC like [Symbiobacteriaceae bacterium]
MTDVSFAGVIGFDWVEDQYLVTIAIHSPGARAGEKGQPTARTVWTVSETAPSPDAAIARLDQLLPRSLTLSHVRSVIFGEEMARHGIGPIMDLLLRSVEIRPTAWLGVTNGKASELLDAQPRQGVMTEGPLGYHDSALQRSSISPALMLTQVAQILQEEGIDLTLPLFRRGNQEPPDPKHFQDEGALSGKPEDETEIVYGGAGAFRGDKLVAWLTPKEARGQMWASHKTGHGAISAECPKPHPSERVVFRLRSSKGRIGVDSVGGKLQGHVRLKVVADVNEITCREPVVDFGDTERLQEILKRRVEDSVQSALEVARREGSDMFGFGQSLFRRAPAAYRLRQAKWDTVLKDLPVTVSVEAQVVRMGQTRERFRWREAH